MSNGCIGSDFDDFLDQEGILDEVEALAIKKVIASMVEQAMGEAHLTKTEMARRMGTSRSQLDRLLDPTCASITLTTVTKAAKALGKKVSINFSALNAA
jgi:predicted XRE-type DNA-binding protein